MFSKGIVHSRSVNLSMPQHVQTAHGRRPHGLITTSSQHRWHEWGTEQKMETLSCTSSCRAAAGNFVEAFAHVKRFFYIDLCNSRCFVAALILL